MCIMKKNDKKHCENKCRERKGEQHMRAYLYLLLCIKLELENTKVAEKRKVNLFGMKYIRKMARATKKDETRNEIMHRRTCVKSKIALKIHKEVLKSCRKSRCKLTDKK